MKIAFFDTKPYDKVTFTPIAEKLGVEINYFDEKLTKETAHLAKGYDASCSFVNDNVSAEAVQTLKDVGIKLLIKMQDLIVLIWKKLRIRITRQSTSLFTRSVAEYITSLFINRKV